MDKEVRALLTAAATMMFIALVVTAAVLLKSWGPVIRGALALGTVAGVRGLQVGRTWLFGRFFK